MQGIARGLGFEGSVSSKSFVLLGEYPGRLTLYHADLYRLEDPEQVQDLALDEISAGGVLVVEWPERAGDGVLPEEHLLVEFEVMDENNRELRVYPSGARAKQINRGPERLMELSIDTASDLASIALSREGRVEAERSWRCDRNHTVELLPAIDTLLGTQASARAI